MSGQVDVGYSVPPFGIAELEQGKIRIIARGNDVPAFADQTVRFIVANAGALEKRPDAFRRYKQGYRDVLDWMYADPQAIGAYAKWARVSESVARRTREEFVPKVNALPDRISGMGAAMADAITYKFISAPLTEDDLAKLIQLQPPLN
jgi:NitT/TauT family transport system substrate-binding protein